MKVALEDLWAFDIKSALDDKLTVYAHEFEYLFILSVPGQADYIHLDERIAFWRKLIKDCPSLVDFLRESKTDLGLSEGASADKL
jgi:hypothetical protein